ncbi:hypothetical protein EVAR_72158_1 [Eumeta japonica]|uniref:Uncharacterized protein n=1 Tax=Eumeta variegata TaxID=151549 RepID=A0A4C1SQ42_EUMVA|nr:hypothetical protein EVAR_72158_1 [Eumeta japonica]
MFILSDQQFAVLLQEGGFDSSRHERVRFVDIGAGDGEISAVLLKAIRILNTDVIVDPLQRKLAGLCASG